MGVRVAHQVARPRASRPVKPSPLRQFAASATCGSVAFDAGASQHLRSPVRGPTVLRCRQRPSSCSLRLRRKRAYPPRISASSFTHLPREIEPAADCERQAPHVPKAVPNPPRPKRLFTEDCREPRPDADEEGRGEHRVEHALGEAQQARGAALLLRGRWRPRLRGGKLTRGLRNQKNLVCFSARLCVSDEHV